MSSEKSVLGLGFFAGWHLNHLLFIINSINSIDVEQTPFALMAVLLIPEQGVWMNLGKKTFF